MNEKQARLIRTWDIGRGIICIAYCIFLLIDTFFVSQALLPSFLALAIYAVFAVLESVGERWMRRNIPQAANRPYPKWARVVSLLILIIVFYGIMKE